MDKTLAGLLGALGVVAAAGPAAAHPEAALAANSYRELLQPIPNAAETLRALDAQEQQAQTPEGRVELAQIAIYAGRPHDHHHRSYYRRPVRHHHHHHHHHDYDRR